MRHSLCYLPSLKLGAVLNNDHPIINRQPDKHQEKPLAHKMDTGWDLYAGDKTGAEQQHSKR
jgi:hypothetical protein